MGLIENESIPRRKMILFFLIDTSASMTGAKIGSVNDAIENDKSLGSGFKIGHSYFCPNLKDRKGNKKSKPKEKKIII